MQEERKKDIYEIFRNAQRLRDSEYDAYIAAQIAGDASAETAHYQLYLDAAKLSDAAEAKVESEILNTPDAVDALKKLSDLNKQMKDTADRINIGAAVLSDLSVLVNAAAGILSLL
jgi:hypothetical protein